MAGMLGIRRSRGLSVALALAGVGALAPALGAAPRTSPPAPPRVELTATPTGSVVAVGARNGRVEALTLGDRGWRSSGGLGAGAGSVGAVLLAGGPGAHAEALVVRVDGPERRVVARKALAWTPVDGWRPSADRFPLYGDPLRMTVTTDGLGELHAAWLADVAGSTVGRAVEVATRSANGLWGPPQRLHFDPDARQVTRTPQIVAGPGGDVAALWTVGGSAAGGLLEASVRRPAGDFGPARALSAPGRTASGDVTVSRDGQVLAAWIERVGAGSELRWAARGRDEDWLASRLLASGRLSRARTVINADGQAFIAWVEDSRDASAVVLAQVDPTSGESQLRARIGAGTTSGRLSELGLLSPAPGEVVAVWRELVGPPARPVARTRAWRVTITQDGRRLTRIPPSDGPRRVTAAGFAALPVRVAVSGSGALAIGWGTCAAAVTTSSCAVRVASVPVR